MKNVNAYTGPQRFAHRGLVQAAPENTLGAFQGAVDGGYEGIEIDVQMTRDGEIVIAHDSNFTRMTLGHPSGGSNRRIRDLTWDEIQKIELPYANHLLSEVPPEHSEIQLLATLPKLVMGQVEGRDYETALAEDGRMAHLMRFSDFDAWLAAQSRSITVEVEVKAPALLDRYWNCSVDLPIPAATSSFPEIRSTWKKCRRRFAKTESQPVCGWGLICAA